MSQNRCSEKRLAIQLFGHLRTFETTFPFFLENVINTHISNGYNIDIFIHTWDVIEYTKEELMTIKWKQGIEQSKNHYGVKLTQEQINFVNKNYKPIKIEIEKQDTKKKNAGWSRNKVKSFREKYAVENNIIYDWVLQTRADILFLKPFLIDTYFENFKNGYVGNAEWNKTPIFNPQKHFFNAVDSYWRGNIRNCKTHNNDIDLILFFKPDIKSGFDNWRDNGENVIEIRYLHKQLNRNFDWSILRFDEINNYVDNKMNFLSCENLFFLKRFFIKTLEIQKGIISLLPYFIIKRYIKIYDNLISEFICKYSENAVLNISKIRHNLYYPKVFIYFICWFVPNKKNRSNLRKYIRR